MAAEKVWNGRFVYLLFISMFVQFGNYIMRPIVSNYALFLGASLATAGVVASVAFAVATCIRPVSGFLSDRISKKTCLIAAAASFSIAGFGCSMAHSVPVLTACCAIQGVAYAFQSVGSVALVALSVPQGRMATAMGWSGIIMSLAMALGPSISSAVSGALGYQASFALGGVLTAIACVMACLFKAPPGAKGSRSALSAEGAAPIAQDGRGGGSSPLLRAVRQVLYTPALPIAVVALFCVCSHAAMSSLLLTLGERGIVQNASLYFLAYALFALAARPVAGRLTDSLGTVKVGVPLLLVGAAGMVVAAFVQGPAVIVACGALMGIGQSSSVSITQAEAVRGVEPAYLGRATNTYYIGMDLGSAFGPFVGGALLGTGTPALLFVFLAATLVLGAVLLVLVGTRRNRASRMRLKK